MGDTFRRPARGYPLKDLPGRLSPLIPDILT